FLAVATAVLLLPYLLSAQSQARGWLPNLFHPSSAAQLALHFGAFLPAVLALLLPARGRFDPGGTIRIAIGVLAAIVVWLAAGAWWATRSARGRSWIEPYLDGRSLVERCVESWVERPFVVLLLAAMIALAVQRLRESASPDAGSRAGSVSGDRLAVCLLTLAVLAVLVPELVYVHDVFTNRSNTVFKFHYQAWLMASLACAYAVFRYRSGHGVRTLLAHTSLVLLLASAIYPVATVRDKQGAWAGRPTLDGLAHLPQEERATIEWVRRSTHPDAVILQAPGSSYRADHARLSAATGRPTLLGWQGHEVQWRGESYGALAAGRVWAAATIYEAGTAEEVRRAIERFSVDYVLIGPVERETYAIDAERVRRLETVAETVLVEGEFRLLRPRRSAARE
ncbi:MAG: DUF2298 domain-containing protein, partial [Thermoanaerobaculia bacterium]|nr:DUF2298 domain-containing protein [Thermoanaerobaculia bacterium]